MTRPPSPPRVVVEMTHPKHYWQFAPVIDHLRRRSARILVIVRDKDVLGHLVRSEPWHWIARPDPMNGLGRRLLAVPRVIAWYVTILRRFRPTLVLAKSSPFATIAGKLADTRVVLMPDTEGVLLNDAISYRLADRLITTPALSGRYQTPTTALPAPFEKYYLNPEVNPRVRAGESLEMPANPVLIRLVGWRANHDLGKSGIDDAALEELIGALERWGFSPVLSTERPLPDRLRRFVGSFDPKRMHAALASCLAYVGDSQTMATEAAYLGVPAFRMNSFVGTADFSVFRDLERQGLLVNCPSPGDLMRVLEGRLSQGPAAVRSSLRPRGGTGDVEALALYEMVTNTIDRELAR